LRERSVRRAPDLDRGFLPASSGLAHRRRGDVEGRARRTRGRQRRRGRCRWRSCERQRSGGHLRDPRGWTARRGCRHSQDGRPVFADEFFGPIEDQLRQIAANPDRVAGREQFVRTIRGYFKQTVDSELIVAEAESQLSPEQQQGVLAWLKSIQEATIAERGGSRAAAEASLQAEEDKTLDEFMQQRREVSLALRLLNQRIEPRAIVSWREVEQAYQRDAKIYNPPSQVRIGRIKLDVVADAAKIERVRALVKEGKKFSEIAKELELTEGGLWQASELPAGGVQELPLADGVLSRLKPLQPDQVSEELVQKEGFVVWFAIMEISQPRARSIYDRDLQLAITRQIQDVRRAIERQRYIASLRSRWVTDDIVEMEERLVAFALERYWR